MCWLIRREVRHLQQNESQKTVFHWPLPLSRLLTKALRVNEVKYVTKKKYWKRSGGTAVFLIWKSTEKSTKAPNFSTLISYKMSFKWWVIQGLVFINIFSLASQDHLWMVRPTTKIEILSSICVLFRNCTVQNYKETYCLKHYRSG